MARWVGFYDAKTLPDEDPVGCCPFSPRVLPESLMECYTQNSVQMHHGQQLLIGESSLHLRASSVERDKWVAAVLHVRSVHYAFCIVKVPRKCLALPFKCQGSVCLCFPDYPGCEVHPLEPCERVANLALTTLITG